MPSSNFLSSFGKNLSRLLLGQTAQDYEQKRQKRERREQLAEQRAYRRGELEEQRRYSEREYDRRRDLLTGEQRQADIEKFIQMGGDYGELTGEGTEFDALIKKMQAGEGDWTENYSAISRELDRLGTEKAEKEETEKEGEQKYNLRQSRLEQLIKIAAESGEPELVESIGKDYDDPEILKIYGNIATRIQTAQTAKAQQDAIKNATVNYHGVTYRGKDFQDENNRLAEQLERMAMDYEILANTAKEMGENTPYTTVDGNKIRIRDKVAEQGGWHIMTARIGHLRNTITERELALNRSLGGVDYNKGDDFIGSFLSESEFEEAQKWYNGLKEKDRDEIDILMLRNPNFTLIDVYQALSEEGE